MGAQKSADRGTNENYKPMVRIDPIVCISSQINIVPVSYEIGECFTNEMHWNRRMAEWNINREVQRFSFEI